LSISVPRCLADQVNEKLANDPLCDRSRYFVNLAVEDLKKTAAKLQTHEPAVSA
jgi:hypothetical protein